MPEESMREGTGTRSRVTERWCVAVLIRAILVLLTGATAGNLSAGQTPPSTQRGARIDAPFHRQVSGAQCYSGTGEHAGNVAFGFPQRAGRGPHPVALTF